MSQGILGFTSMIKALLLEETHSTSKGSTHPIQDRKTKLEERPHLLAGGNKRAADARQDAVADFGADKVRAGGRRVDVRRVQRCDVIGVQQRGVAQVVADEQGRVQAGKVQDRL